MSSPTTYHPPVQAALDAVDEAAYTFRPDGTKVAQTSSSQIIATMLDLLDVHPNMRVLEIGTGSGFSTALLAHLVGPGGHVVSVDIDPELTVRADQLLRLHGHLNADLCTGDGVMGANGFPKFHRIIAWATVEQLPAIWVAQAVAGAVIVAPVNLVGLAKTFAVVRARHDAGSQGLVGEQLIPGGFVEACDQVINQWLVPPRGVDALVHDAAGNPWWLSAAWLRSSSAIPHDDAQGQAILRSLLEEGCTVPGPLTTGESTSDFSAYLLAARPHHLTTAALGDPVWRIGCTTPGSAALIARSDAPSTIHAGGSRALHTLANWADQWRELDRPGFVHLRPELWEDEHGWYVRATLAVSRSA